MRHIHRFSNTLRQLGLLIVLLATSPALIGCSPIGIGSDSVAEGIHASAASCETTEPNGSTPPGEDPNEHFLGNGKLWTGLTSDDIVDYVRSRPTGELFTKWSWWRGPDVSDEVTVTGQRLDADASPMQADITDGYGLTGFQSSELTFPTEGCWEITGSVENTPLTFTVFVMKD